MKPYLNYFKNLGLTPRIQQNDALQWLEENWEKYDYFILQLPTGVGKTHFALAASNRCDNAWIATSTLQLMNQYLSTNGEIVDIKGRSNYQCGIIDYVTCDYGPCAANGKLKYSCRSNNICPYEVQKRKAIDAKWAITNYSYLIYSSHCGFISTGEVKPRDIAIFDEAHNLEKHLVGFASQDYDFSFIKKCKYVSREYVVSDNIEENAMTLEALMSELSETADSYKSQIEKVYEDRQTRDRDAKMNKLKSLNSKLRNADRLLQPLKFWYLTRNANPSVDRRWIIHPDMDKNLVKLVPLKADFIFKHYFAEKIAQKYIFMSATIGDPKVFCDENGIPEERTAFFESDTPFDPRKSPVISLTGKDSVNTRYGELDKNLGKIVKIVEKIMENHEKDGGIIHTGNYKIARYIWNNIGKKYKQRILFKEMNDESNMNNGELLQRHEESIKDGNASVLLSPSLMEGVDLKDDLSRWQLIVKLPFSSLGDIRVKRKTELDNRWYSNEMAMKLVQACGRSTRTEDDWSRTYIIDDMFPSIFNKIKFPKWFRNRVSIYRD